MSYEKAHIARNTVVQIVGKGLSTVLGLATFALLWRLLDQTAFGQFTLATTFLAIFATLVDFGLTLTTVQLISEDGSRQERIIANLLTLRLISGAVFFAAAPVIALAFPYDHIVEIAILIGAVTYYSGSVSQMLIGVFQKNMVMIKPMIAENVNRLLVLAGIIAMWFLGGGLIGVMWVFVFGSLVQLATVAIMAHKYIPLRLQLNWDTWKEIIGRSWPIGVSIFFNLIYLKGDIIFLSLYRSEAEIGLYGTAYKVLEILASIPVMYMGLILPLLVQAWAQKSVERFKEVLQDAFDFFAIVALPAAVGAMVVSTELVVFLASDTYTAAGPLLYILGPALLAVFYGALFGHAVVGIQKQRQMTWAYVGIAVVTVIGYITTIPAYGMYGAAAWTLISESLLAVIAAIVVLRALHMRLAWRMFSIAFLAALAMGVFIWFLPPMHVLFEVAIGAGIYMVALTLLGGPSLRDLKKLFPVKPKSPLGPISNPLE